MADEQQPATAPDMDNASITAALESLEAELSAPKGSLVALMLQDDWSLVIRGHALIEGAASTALTAALGTKLARPLSKLPLGEGDACKLAFLKDLGILSSDERGWIRRLSQIRNMLAHDPRELSFELTDFIGRMDKQQRTAFAGLFLFDIAQNKRDEFRQFVLDQPKLAVASTVIRIVASLAAKAKYAKVEQLQAEKDRERLEMLDQLLDDLDLESKPVDNSVDK